MPIMSGKLILDVMDLDGVKDEQAGALIFDFKELLFKPSKHVAGVFSLSPSVPVQAVAGLSVIGDHS